MRKAIWTLAVFAALAAAGGWFASAPQRVAEEVLAGVREPGDAAAGALVFNVGGCVSCHQSAGQDDRLKLGGGRPLNTPFGAFYPPNISQDAKDGIGAWSVDAFADAMLAGRTPTGQPYYPAFPFTSYARLAPKDVRDLFAYMKTLPAVAGKAPPHGLGFPFNVRRGVGLWHRAFFAPGPLAPAPDLSQARQRGRYLVEGPGHCAECHSPRNLAGAIDASRRLMGGPAPDGKGKAPDITAHGLKDWSEADVADALSSGMMPSGDFLGGAMAEVVRNTARLPASDRAAIAGYLKGYGPK